MKNNNSNSISGMQHTSFPRGPRLRAIPIRPVDYQGPAWLLNDPLGLSEQGVILPEALGPLLMLFDGNSSIEELHSSFAEHLGAISGPGLLKQLLDAFDNALLLENDSFYQARAAAVSAYRSLPYRPPVFAGKSYPADAFELQHVLNGFLANTGELEPGALSSRAIFSPHIDYARGGHIYAQIWKSMTEVVRQTELVIVLATDHYSSEAITLTQQNYATPYGILPTYRPIVDALAERIDHSRPMLPSSTIAANIQSSLCSPGCTICVMVSPAMSCQSCVAPSPIMWLVLTHMQTRFSRHSSQACVRPSSSTKP